MFNLWENSINANWETSVIVIKQPTTEKKFAP